MRRVLCTLVLSSVVLAGVAAQPAFAQPPPDLVPTHLNAREWTGAYAPSDTPGRITVTSYSCTDTGGRVTYIATGPAVGAYNGTFRQAGSLTLGARVIPTSPTRPIVGAEARFIIHSHTPRAVVVGRKTLRVNPSLAGTCGNPVFEREFGALYETDYEAVIHAPMHTCTDRGGTAGRFGFFQDPGGTRSDFEDIFLFPDGMPPFCRANDDDD
jgi:hypothetical protein